MSQKVEASNPLKNKKTSEEENYEGEFEEMTQKVLKNPSIISSFPSENLDSGTPRGAAPNQRKRNSIFSKKRSKDEKEEEFYEEVKHEKKVGLLKNYTVEATKNSKSREDYFILFSFICLFGGSTAIFEEIKQKSKYLQELQIPNDSPKDILQDKRYISQVLISAANQHEDNVIKEIIKNDAIGYIVNIPVLLAFIKADLHGLLKSLLKVVDAHSKNNIKAIRGFIPNSVDPHDSPSHPLRLQKTLRNFGGGSFDEKSPPAKVFNVSVMSEGESLLKENPNKKAPSKDYVIRDPPPKSAYGNVVIEARFENMLPYLIQLEKLDIVETLIEAFGERNINHMNLFILHGQEKAALKYYKKAVWDLTEAQIQMLINKRMWTFLCNIDDDFEKNLLFSDNVFSNIKDMLVDGKILTEIVLLFMTLPVNGWRQNQAVALIELASGLLKEDPDTSRLVQANNPILTCAQLSYILKNLAARFRFLQNDLITLSQKLQQLALNLQGEYRENNLYSLYLKTLPTGLTMLDYILQMEMKDLVETKFTKGLVREFWDNESLITGSRTQISSLSSSVHISKRFQWTQDFQPQTTESFSFQFGNVVNSAKYMLFVDLVFLSVLYGIVDDYTYNKINFFRKIADLPEVLDSLPPYTVDVTYPEYPGRTIARLVIMINYWFFFLFRTVHIARQSLKMKIYLVGYIVAFLFLTLTLLSLAVFPSYESALEHQLLIKFCLVFTRTALAYVIGTTMLGYARSGETITVIAVVTANLIMILTMLIVYIVAAAEVMENFFRPIYLFSSVKESFFSLVEILFGSITFIDLKNVDGNESLYLSTNSFMLIFAFSSTILATFLLIAYLSSIYELVRQDASYQNTCWQYYYVQIYSGMEFKGFYSFPPIVMILVIPLLVLYRIPAFSKSIDMFLLKVRFFGLWMPFQILKYLGYTIFYYLPVLYIKNLALIFVGKINSKGPVVLHLIGWAFGGIFVLFYLFCKDVVVLVKVMCSDFTVVSPRQKLYQRVTDDDVIYIHRYESLKAGLISITKENPEIESILYMELLNYLMHGWKVTNQDVPRSVLLKKEAVSPKDRLVALIKKHAKRLYGSKWLRNIYDAKKKFFRELLDGFLTFKTKSMKTEDATIDPYLVLDMLKDVHEENIVYLRGRQIFAIQMVLLSMQSKEQISTLNKIEELEKKIDNMFKIYYAQYGENKDVKWSRVIEGVKEIRPLKEVEKPQSNERKAAIFGNLVT